MSGRARIWDENSRTAAEVEQPASAAPRVLVIDRDNLHRMIICRAADRAGCVPAGAANLAEATRLMESGDFHCITLDLAFGRDAVCDFLSRLGALGCKSKILVMGHGDTAGWQEDALRLGTSLALHVEVSVAKPLDVGMLRYALEQLRIQSPLERGVAGVGAQGEMGLG